MNTNLIENPRCLAINELHLRLDSSNSNNNGVVITVKALDKHWVSNRVLSRYEPPPIKTNLLSLQAWKVKMNWYIDDLKWLLSMQYHIFWSHIIHHSDSMDMLVSFLQEANPPYKQLYDDSSVLEIYNTIYNKVMHIFTRLTQSKESETEWMKESYLGSILYDNFIFSIPIMFDLCLLYGPANMQKVSTIITKLFQIQPNYLTDLKTAILFVKQMFKFIIFQVNPSASMIDADSGLPETFGGNPKSFKSANIKSTEDKKPVATSPVDLVLYLLDTSLTVKTFLECYSESIILFQELEFHLCIVQLYENAIPNLYTKLEITDGCNEESEQFKQIDLARMEMIDTVRLMLAASITDIMSDKQDKENHVNKYFIMVMDCLSEKSFIRDYNMFHPVDVDLDIIGQAYGDIDPMKSNFILQAIYSHLEDEDISEKQIGDIKLKQPEIQSNGHTSTETHLTVTRDCINDIPEDIRTESIISEVKDIMPHLGDGYILKCLEFYGFNSERVINSILEGALDESLQKLDETMPLIPVDPLDEQFLTTGIDRLNIYDNDEFDIMTRDKIDHDKVHKGKKKSKFKNLNDMLNDKSHVRELSNVYSKFSIVSDEATEYDDEYDDTYDTAGETSLTGRGRITGHATDDTEYTQRRQFETPRILKVQSESEDEQEDAEEEQIPQPSQSHRDAFCTNPEELRERRAIQRGANQARHSQGNKFSQPPRNIDVVGRAKGQGQDKEVLTNRHKKDVHKSSRGNHNRRAGAQWKRSQGFIPS